MFLVLVGIAVLLAVPVTLVSKRGDIWGNARDIFLLIAFIGLPVLWLIVVFGK